MTSDTKLYLAVGVLAPRVEREQAASQLLGLAIAAFRQPRPRQGLQRRDRQVCVPLAHQQQPLLECFAARQAEARQELATI